MIYCANPSEQFKSYQEEIEAAVLDVMRGNQYILGEQVEKLEVEFANYIGVKYSVGVANGTEAIELALRALNIGPGDEIITVSHTATATVAAIDACGAQPVLVDIEDDFYCIDIDKINSAITEKTKAIIAVHIYGQPVDILAISEICKDNKLFLIEDVSQAHGAKINNKKLGSFGIVSCFSCYPTKNLGAIGDAGLITSNNEDLIHRIKMLREYGWKTRYCSEIPGRNSRLDELQAAVLRVKLKYLDNANNQRRVLATIYTENLKNIGVKVPLIRNSAEHVFHLYVIRISQRDKFKNFLNNKGIFPGIHYPIPIHLQPAYFHRVRTPSLMTRTEAAALNVISLPIYPELQVEDLMKIINEIESWVSRFGN